MNKWKRSLIGVIACCIAVVLVSAIWFSFEIPWRKASAGLVNSNGVFTIPEKSGDIGTSNNPFVILEIVPNENMAQMGYLVDGQEPIDLFKAMDSTDKADVISRLSQYMAVGLDNTEVKKQAFVTDIEDQDWKVYYWNYYVNANQYGYYERLQEKTGNYEITLSTSVVKDPVTLVEKMVYEYRLKEVTAGTGRYQWIGYDYAKSSGLTDTSMCNNVVRSDSMLDSGDTLLQKIYGYRENIAVYNAYTGKKINNELFKKYALGLVYKNNDFSQGEDSDSYEFTGWYKEPECVNPYNISEAVTSDITLYARWKTLHTGGIMNQYTVSFNANAGSEEVIHLPVNIEYINKDSRIAEPKAIPLRKGYVFTGWYKEVACTGRYDFTRAITDNTALYAGWEAVSDKRYTISFNANAGVGNESTVTELPADVTNVLVNGRDMEFKEIEPKTVPVRGGYIFAGWYWNRACTNAFVFEQAIPSGVMSDTIVLYASWIPVTSAKTYKISFQGNKPFDAISKVTGIPQSLSGISYGYYINDTFPTAIPALEGNIHEKIKNYKVKVITVTPADFRNQASNLGLIDRANLIVMNETCDIDLKGFWSKYRNKELFSKSDVSYNITASKFTGNDLPWTATLRLMNKVTGSDDVPMSPVIYDYSIYKSVLASTDSSIKTTVGFESKFSDNFTFSIGNVDGYSSNVYKLYLMTQQFNPITLHNAYIATSKIVSAGSFIAASSTGSNNNFRSYWNKYTLLPYVVLSQSDWNSTTKTFLNNALETIGINNNYELQAGKGLIHNRVLLYQAANSLTDGFLSYQLTSAEHKDMNEYYYPKGGILPERYTTAQGIYYMLNNSEIYKNFSKNLNILEIEPSDSFKSSDFWFWYISRYVPNYTGTYTVVQKNSAEFIGDIDNLNSRYDAIYMGADASTLNTKFMPNSIVTATATANQQITIGMDQVIEYDFQKKEQVPHTKTEYFVSGYRVNGYTYVSGSGKSVVSIQGNTWGVTYDNIGKDKTWLNLAVTTVESTNTRNRNYRYVYKDSTGLELTKYLRDISVKSNTYSDISSKFEENSNGNIEEWNGWRWVLGNIILNNYYMNAETLTTYTSEWVGYPANTQVLAGDIILFPANGNYFYTSGSFYRYAHVGAKVTAATTRRGSFDNINDTIDKHLYSGNDITKAKMDNLLAFAQAGYPIIINSELIDSSGNIDSSIIDKSSYIYNLLLKLKTDNNYRESYFQEKDITRDDKFVKALNNKNFQLLAISKPVNYVDRTQAAYQSYKDDQVYINGVADGSDSNINEKNMEFTIKIDSANTGYYEIKLYIDSNADGKFDEEEEKLDSLEVVNNSTKKNTRVNRLVGGQTYNIVRQIEDYVGSIPWKLEIADVNNPLITDDITGLCAIKVAQKKDMKVLQIISNGTDNVASYKPTVYFPTNAEIEVAKAKHGGKDINEAGVTTPEALKAYIEAYFNDCIREVNSTSNYVTETNVLANAGWFYYYTKMLDEFKVEFYRLSVTEFSTLASIGRITGDSTVYMKDGKCSYLADKGINMLILGYADCYSDITNSSALELIDGFISAGNTTLFTHDTTSFVNISNKTTFGSGSTYWGYNINQYFRQLLGMDRFDVMDNKGSVSALSGASDKPYTANTLQSAASFYTEIGASSVGRRALTQGMSNVTIGGDSARVTSATKENNGQIVMYPYMIPDKLTVASTHAQYYQMDMEADDIVVWYCLEDDSKDYYKMDNDVRNNYYIYNRGNITYSGVGHSGGLSNDERKLFVNTMIAAYRAGTVPTKPIITNKDKSSADDMTDFLYVDYDATENVGEAKPFGTEIFSYTQGTDNIYAKRVYFTPKNYSIILNKKMTVHYYPVIITNTSTGTQIKTLTEYPLNMKTYEYDSETGSSSEVDYDNFDYNQTYSNGSQAKISLRGGFVQSNYDYYVDIPISDNFYSSMIAGNTDVLEGFALDSNSRFGIQIQVIMRYGRSEAANVPLVGTRNAVFMKRGMFVLD